MRLSVAALVVVVACSAQAPKAASTVTTTSGTSAAPVLPRLPATPSPLAPAQTEVTGAISGEVVTETESCAGCHAEAAAEWRSSAHAFGSFNNPIYRVAVDRFRATVGKDASRFCAGCHDVALLVDGAMSADVAPTDARAHGGVTCRVCHGIEETRADGNGSYVPSSTPVPIPRDGDDASLQAHKARMALGPLRTAAMCGACHRSFLSPETGNPSHLVGQDELGAWERSPYAGSLAAHVDEPIDRAQCGGCHMPLEDATRGDAAAKNGRIRSHRFAGGNSWLAAMRADGAQLEAVRNMLRGAASIDVAAVVAADGTRTLPADGAKVIAGQATLIDVVVRNERVGHRFPGGVLDAQDTWVEVTVRDARGKPIAGSPGVSASEHVLRAVQVDEHGAPLLLRETDLFRTPVFNHTVAPRDAEVVRYRLDVPATLEAGALPLQVTARLRHRSRNLELSHAVCADASTPRGSAFSREVKRRTGATMNPCVPEPVIDVSESEVWIGEGWQARALAGGGKDGPPAWRRLYDHGLGLLHALQEDVDAARPSLERALDLVPANAVDRAMVLEALARVAIREGRTDEAMQRLDEAETFAPGHPAIAHARGEALGNVWRWKEATLPLQRAALLSPLDDGLWAHLSIAYGSADEPREALDAARFGLSLSPRDSDMLRVQALALERLGAPADDIARAREALARWRPPDDAPGLKNACSQQLAWCALERVPVHVHPLRPTP